MKLKFKKLTDTAQTPTYATPGAACFDLYLDSIHAAWVPPAGAPDRRGATVLCKTGIALDIPEGYCVKIYSRSGHGFKHNISLVNSVGIIDSDYKGEIMVKLTSLEAGQTFTFFRGDRIAQGELVPVTQVEFEEVTTISTSERGEGGFGSTGK